MAGQLCEVSTDSTFTQPKPSSSRRACWIRIYSILKNSLILRNTLVVGLRTGVNGGFGRVSHLNRLKTFITIIVWAWVRYIHRAFPFLKSYFVMTQFYSEESAFASVSVHVDYIPRRWAAYSAILVRSYICLEVGHKIGSELLNPKTAVMM